MDEEPPIRAEHDDRHGAVAEIRGADARARRDLDHPIVLVDDIDELVVGPVVGVQFLVRRKRPTMRR